MSNSQSMARRQSAAYALETRQKLGVSMRDPVDVYDAVRRSNLWLMFQPLDGLFGTYQQSEGAAGVVINVKVHPALQRFTAAHELGHHVLGHSDSMDPESHIGRFTNLESQELDAQFFAAEFLMPIAAVNSIASELDIEKSRVDANDVYQISLRLRTSYQATVNRLQTLQWFGRARANELRKVTPATIKSRMLRNPLPDARSDVWQVTRETSHVAAQVGDRLRISLSEAPSSGYRWHLRVGESMQIDYDEFVPDAARDAGTVGGEGSRHFYIAANEPDRSVVQGALRRQWERDKVADEFEVVVSPTMRPERGLYSQQRYDLVRS